MNISYNSVIDTERPGQGIMDMKNAGMDRFFLRVGVRFPAPTDKEQDFKYVKKYAPETIVERYHEALIKARENGMLLALMQAPKLPLKADTEALRPLLRQAVEQCTRLAHENGCQYLLLESPDERADRDYFLQCARYAQQYGIMLLLKNQTRDVGGHLVRGFCAEAAQAAGWVDSLNEELGQEIFGFCVDIGVCNLCGNYIQSYINEIGTKRIKAVILRDCDGKHDTALLPFTCVAGGTDWLEVIRGLRDIGFAGELVLDASGTYSKFSPLLRPYLYPLVRQTAQYFKWQIEIERNLQRYNKLVLFGAGNMCRNYMKCYGDQYPPLYTCDNNPKLWGTTFEGLEVHDPQDLKNLPSDCGVIICNVYYREIEKQLRDLGITNIGYFNDEYMPSFYYDRIEREE